VTAFDLIDSIFSRHQEGVAGNVRNISPEQFQYLSDLIDADPEGGAVRRGQGDSFIWMPSGRHKYALTRFAGSRRCTLTKFSTIDASAMGRLF
jgi:hypothetical protein